MSAQPLATALERLAGLELELGQVAESHRGREADWSAYETDPVGWARDVLGFEPWSRQVELMRAVIEHPLVVCRGANGTGKDAVSFGPIALHHVFVRHGTVVAVAPTSRQGVEIGMRELGRWWRAGRLPGERFRTALRAPDGRGVLIFTSNDVSRLTGYHPARLLVLLTECQGLDPYVWEASLANAIGDEDRILAVGNPLAPRGMFYQVSRDPSWHSVRMPAHEHPNVVEGRTVIPGGISRLGIARIEQTYGRGSPQAVARIEAEFPSDTEETLVRRDWLEAAAERWEAWRRWDTWTLGEASQAVGVGVDVARLGTDRSILAVRRGPVLTELRTIPRGNLMATTGRLVSEFQRIREGADYPGRDPFRPALYVPAQEPKPGRHAVRPLIDEAGVGGGVVDRLVELGWPVVGFNSAFSPIGPKADRYLNMRSQAFWELREKLERGEIALPRHEELWQELLATNWLVHSSGKIQIEGKDAIRATIKRSPDHADAVALAFFGAHKAPTIRLSSVDA
jgi:hypothetical protein